jgi:hypothetical protein
VSILLIRYAGRTLGPVMAMSCAAVTLADVQLDEKVARG